jgi:putative glutamine amidotransferase
VTAYAPDGVLEGTELPDKTFILSVQWHPEDLFREHEPMRRLFRAFVQAANGTHAP